MSKGTSFAVGSKYGPRSSVWNISVKKTGNAHDLYVTTKKAPKLFHVSIHESGQWHLKAMLESGKEEMVLKSHEDLCAPGTYKEALTISIPDSSLRNASVPKSLPNGHKVSQPKHWLPRPSEGGVAEICIMRWDYRYVAEEWPGKSAGTNLLFVYLINDFEQFGVLMRLLPKEHPNCVKLNAYLDKELSNYTVIKLDSPERRGFIFAKSKNNGLLISEYAID